MLAHYRMFARYNRWANSLLYAAVAELTEDDFRQNKGAFFGSLHATLNHILAADRIWMRRFTGRGEAPASLDAILYDARAELVDQRMAEDARIIGWIDGLTDAALSDRFTYTPISNPVEISQRLAPALAHFFNHQTHHRGQCHMTLTALGQPSLALDMSYYLRTDEGKPFAL